MRSFIYFITIGTLLAGLNSCKKNQDVDSDTQTSADYALCKMGFSTIVPTTNNITVNEEGVREMGVYTCATVTLSTGDTTNWPANGDTLVYLVDYGTGCVDHDGRTKTGKLWVSFMSDYGNTIGGKVKIVPESYRIDGVEYQGEIVLNNDGNYQYTQTITNGMCVSSNWWIKYQGTTVKTWLSGYNTPADPSDDVYSVTENSTGENRNGKSFTVATISPLLKSSDCKWIETGVIDITPSGLATRRIDFGSGNCDNQASVTINGNTFNFEMQ